MRLVRQSRNVLAVLVDDALDFFLQFIVLVTVLQVVVVSYFLLLLNTLLHLLSLGLFFSFGSVQVFNSQ